MAVTGGEEKTRTQVELYEHNLEAELHTHCMHSHRCKLKVQSHHFLLVSTEQVLAFAWEPINNKFSFIHGESPRINVSFYAIQPKGKVDHLSECMYCLSLWYKTSKGSVDHLSKCVHWYTKSKGQCGTSQ